jgi:fluoride ion exporter CrcB/FEX
MLSHIWVSLRGALGSAVRFWISGMAALQPAVPRDALGAGYFRIL